MKPVVKLQCLGLLAILGSVYSAGQKPVAAAAKVPVHSPPAFRISFENADAIPGVVSSRVIMLPFECTNDGSAFFNVAGPHDLTNQSLVSVSPAHESHVFHLDQVPNLYDVRSIAHYVSDSSVVFLVEAATEDKQAKFTITTSKGERVERTRNVAEHHSYLLVFDREGRENQLAGQIKLFLRPIRPFRSQ